MERVKVLPVIGYCPSKVEQIKERLKAIDDNNYNYGNDYDDEYLHNDFGLKKYDEDRYAQLPKLPSQEEKAREGRNRVRTRALTVHPS